MTTSSRPNTPYRAGDLLRVPVLFSDQQGIKARPAVVVSVDEVARSRSDIIVVPVSSRAGGAFGDRPVLDWQAAGLNRPTYFKGVIATIEERLVERRWGRLTARDYARVQELLREILDI